MTKVKKSEISLNEKDALQDMLNAEKMLMNAYSLAIIEGGSKQIKNTLSKNYQAESLTQFSVFEEMMTRGYYPITEAKKEDIIKMSDTFKNVSKELEG